MKMILGILMTIAAVAVTGGLYLAIRRPEAKRSDLEKLSSICGQIAHSVHQLGDFLVRLYSFTVTKVTLIARKGQDGFSESPSSISEVAESLQRDSTA